MLDAIVQRTDMDENMQVSVPCVAEEQDSRLGIEGRYGSAAGIGEAPWPTA